MPANRNIDPETTKLATPAKERAASASTNDGLQKTRENAYDRAEVNKQKTPQGLADMRVMGAIEEAAVTGKMTTVKG